MRKIWVVLLSIVAFALGAAGGLVYFGGTGGIASLKVACVLLDTAESAGMLGKQQRVDVVHRVVQEIRKRDAMDSSGDVYVEQLKTGCPDLPNW